MNTKWLDWAFHSSMTATKSGYGESGVWVLKIKQDGETKNIQVYISALSAVRAAFLLDEAWDPMFLSSTLPQTILDAIGRET